MRSSKPKSKSRIIDDSSDKYKENTNDNLPVDDDKNSIAPKPNSNICDGCITGCAICLDETLNKCTVCNGIYYKDLYSTTCGTTCPDGQYTDDINSPNICVKCPYTCATCTSSVICATCNLGYYLDKNN
mgnify:CR=1 FL=1